VKGRSWLWPLGLALILLASLTWAGAVWGDAPHGGPMDPLPAATPPLTPRAYVPFVVNAWPTPEVRALWVTRWDYRQPEDVERIVERAAYAHFNTLFFQVRGQADAYYRSRYEPWAARLTGTITETLGQDPGWDPLGVALEEAHRRGMKLHAWVNVYPVWATFQLEEDDDPTRYAPPEGTTPPHLFWTLSHAYYGWADWRQWYETDEGDFQPMLLTDTQYGYLWASPAVTLTAQHILSVCQDIVTQYEVDGLHLDYIRYAGSKFSHDPISQARFSETRAISDTITWEDWQRSQVTELVDRIYREVVFPRPEVMLTAAVWPIYRNWWGWTGVGGYETKYQDSQGWMQRGQIDGLAPMLYANLSDMGGEEYPSRFSTLVRDFVDHANGRFVLAGIYAGTDLGDPEEMPYDDGLRDLVADISAGAYAGTVSDMPYYDDFEDIAASIELAREAGAAGQVLFSYGLIEERDYWDEFREGPYRRPAQLPKMGWRGQE